MEKKNRQLKKEYQQNPPPMGVFLVRNMVNDKVFVGVSQDLHGIINRYRFQLAHGKHPNARLQKDWNEFGSESFTFEILDQLPAQGEPQADYRKELEFLEDLWLDQLQPFDERGYNERKLSTEEKLRRIAARRSSES